MSYDLAVVGAGIVGLAHALAAARRGLSVVVIDRERRASGASVRNFGLVVVSGQDAGDARRRAERSRQIWLELAADAGIEIVHRGLLVAAQRPQALAVLDAFASSELGQDCKLLTRDDLVGQQPQLDPAGIVGGLYSPHELRVESRDVLPRLAAFLAERHGVEFRWGTSVTAVDAPWVETNRGRLRAARIVVCPGDDRDTLFSERIAPFGIRRCKLQMLRLTDPGFRLAAALVSDLSLGRYGGFAAMPGADALQARLARECAPELADGVHLIVVQSADGSLVIGDSHDYSDAPDPFASDAIDRLILGEYTKLFGRRPEIAARWTGTYASASDRPMLRDAPSPETRIVMVTSGTGASTGFAIGEETIEDLFAA